MGIHIIPYTLGERQTIAGWGSAQIYLNAEEYKAFDSIRYSGDSDFIFDSELEWEYTHDNPERPDFQNSYRRPKDFKKAKDWIQNNIPEKDRLLKLMEDMEENLNLWIFISY